MEIAALVGYLSIFCLNLASSKSMDMKLNDVMLELYNKTFSPLCDITAGCDINCCSDPDCSAEDVEVFECENEEEELDEYFCTAASANPIFCYELENSPYLGKYYPVARRQEAKEPFKFKDQSQEEFTVKKHVYGSSLLTLTDNGLQEITFPVSFGKGFCVGGPVKFLVNQMSHCVTQINDCGNRFTQLRDFEINEIAQMNNTVKIAIRKFDVDFKIDGSEYYTNFIGKRSHVEQTKVNSTTEQCNGIVSGSELRLKWDGNRIKEAILNIYLTSVPIPRYRTIYLRQTFTVNYINGNDLGVRRGYHLRDRIAIVGVFNGNETDCLEGTCNESWNDTLWTRDKSVDVGTIPAPRKGENYRYLESIGGICGEKQTAEFGYDAMSECSFVIPEPEVPGQCESFSEKISGLVDRALNFKGIDDGVDGLAPHIKDTDARPASNDTANDTCVIDSSVQIEVIYLPLDKSRFRIIGVRSRRTEANCYQGKCTLQWSILYRNLNKKSTSTKWWNYITSREGGSYSWVNLFNAEIFETGPVISKSHEFQLFFIVMFLLIILNKYY